MYLRINAFALTGRTNDNTQGVASLALGYALIGLSARLHVGTHGEKTHATLEAAALLSRMGSNLNGTWIVDTHS